MMKLIFESEDCIIGMLFGVLLLALSGRWFTLSFARPALLVVSAIFAVIIVLDVLHEFGSLGKHFFFTASALIHNLFDLLLIMVLFSSAFGLSLPLLNGLLPLLSDEGVLFWLGVFEIGSHIVWLAMAPFNVS